MARYSYSQLETLWINAGGPRAVAPLMAAIAMAESGGNSQAVSPTNDYGLWQINSTNFNVVPGGQSGVFNPENNAKAAVAIYHSQGLNAWSTYRTGAYKQFFSGNAPTSAQTTSAAGIGSGGLLDIPSQITTFFSDANTFVTAITWIARPSSWIRIGAFLTGVVLLLLAIHAFLAVGEGGDILPKVPAIVPVPV